MPKSKKRIKVEHDKSYQFEAVLRNAACPDCGELLDWEPDLTGISMDFYTTCEKCKISFIMEPVMYKVELDRWE